MNALVLLAGCGVGDGSCVEEVILTYTVLDKYGHSYAIAAVDMDVPSVDHRTEAPGPERNVLTESARIGRGRIQELSALDLEPFDALLLPGGIGLISNYRHCPQVLSGHRLSPHDHRPGPVVGGSRPTLPAGLLPGRGKKHLLHPRLSEEPELL